MNDKYRDLNEVAQKTYNTTYDKLTADQLWQIIDHVGPFVFNGPQKEGSRKAALIEYQAIERLQGMRP